MKFRPNIGAADYRVKARKVRGFLEGGDRVRVTIMFRGREAARPETGRAIIDRLTGEVGDIANRDEPRMGGRDMTVTFTPKGRRDGGPGVREPRRPNGPPPAARRRLQSPVADGAPPLAVRPIESVSCV